MPKASWNASENEITKVHTGLNTQAVAHGLDVNDPKVKAFVDHATIVLATSNAESKWLRTIIDDLRNQLNNLKPES
jgi:hypothetical protein